MLYTKVRTRSVRGPQKVRKLPRKRFVEGPCAVRARSVRGPCAPFLFPPSLISLALRLRYVSFSVLLHNGKKRYPNFTLQLAHLLRYPPASLPPPHSKILFILSSANCVIPRLHFSPLLPSTSLLPDSLLCSPPLFILLLIPLFSFSEIPPSCRAHARQSRTYLLSFATRHDSCTS